MTTMTYFNADGNPVISFWDWGTARTPNQGIFNKEIFDHFALLEDQYRAALSIATATPYPTTCDFKQLDGTQVEYIWNWFAQNCTPEDKIFTAGIRDEWEATFFSYAEAENVVLVVY
jgi:hypothetical protein